MGQFVKYVSFTASSMSELRAAIRKQKTDAKAEGNVAHIWHDGCEPGKFVAMVIRYQ